MKKKIRQSPAPTARIAAVNTLHRLSSQQRGLVLATEQPSTQQMLSVLRGQRIVIVGGDARPRATEGLQDQLGLASVAHCVTRQADASSRAFARKLDKIDPLLVIWICGLSRTAHGLHLHARCRELAIPHVDCIRIPHANALVAALLRLRLFYALQRRWRTLNSSTALSGGGAP